MKSDLSDSALQRFSGEKPADAYPHSAITNRILGAAIKVHSALGPGFLEAIYERALCIELERRGIPFQKQVVARVVYDGFNVGTHRLDLVVEGQVVVELKAVKEIEDVHLATVISYLRATKLQTGLVLNFRASKLAIRRVAWTGQTAETLKG